MLDLWTNSRLALSAAFRGGYQIRVASDGNARFEKTDGTVYTISDFRCDCPDAAFRGGSYQGHCKHAIWLSQIYPCPRCGAWAVLVRTELPTGEEIEEFRCKNTHLYSWYEVKEGRRHGTVQRRSG